MDKDIRDLYLRILTDKFLYYKENGFVCCYKVNGEKHSLSAFHDTWLTKYIISARPERLNRIVNRFK